MPLHTAPRDERPAIGFGLLGYGFMGRAHSHSLHSIGHMCWPSAARPVLVAVAGRTEAGVAEAATRYGYSLYTTDWHDMVSDPAVDVFDNVTTDAAHVEPTLAAIAAGKHVICEKPLASTAADCAHLYEAAAAAGVKHLVCFNYRFFPAVRLAWELVHGGELGELYQARFRYSQEWRAAPGPLPSAAGAQAIIACHVVDQARFLCGEIASVQASISSPVTTPDRLYRGGPIDQDDVVAMVARFDSGLVATLDASLVAPGRRNHLAWELNGSLGSVAWSLEDPNILQGLPHQRRPHLGFHRGDHLRGGPSPGGAVVAVGPCPGLGARACQHARPFHRRGGRGQRGGAVRRHVLRRPARPPRWPRRSTSRPRPATASK